MVLWIVRLPYLIPSTLIADKRRDERTRRILREHPELYDLILRIMSDFDPFGIIVYDAEEHYERDAVYMIQRLATCSDSGDVFVVLSEALDWGYLVDDDAVTKAAAEKIWETWQEYKNR